MRTVWASLVFGVVSSSASAELFYTTYPRDGSDYLATVDTSTGQVSEIGSLGVGLGLGPLAWDSTNDVLFGVGFGSGLLYEIEPTTAAVTPRGAPNTPSTTALAYDPVRDELYAARNSGVLMSQLYRVDRTSGAYDPVGAVGGAATSLVYSANADTLLFSSPFPEQLGAWNPDTGAQSILGNSLRFSGMAWNAGGDVLFGLGTSGSVPTDGLYSIDPTTGGATLVATLSQARFFAGLTAIPAPGAFGILLLSTAGALPRRRRPSP
ncbi:MAG: hypothetical protein KDA20_08660 [Phycisphaerales bacterium]|nr:hypothetical protein [Phycisphaerales bacterium]